MLMEIIAVGNKIEMQPIPDRTSLAVPEMGNGAAERAARCAQMRGFKEYVAKAERKKARKARMREEINNAFGGGIFIGSIILGLLAISLL
jgi:hypothetical protein